MDLMHSSFDVFDTVVTRSVSCPTAVFMLVGQRAPQKKNPVEFCHIRIQAERGAEKLAKGGQATLAEIYRELGRLTGWCEVDLLALQQRELEIERLVIHAVPEILLEIAAARRPGSPILFISDMYLPREEIIALLTRSGAWNEGDRLYVSCEWGSSKRAGELFHRVLDQERLKAAQLVHTGDNEIGDHRIPQKLGICARLVEPAALNPYEQILDRYNEQTVGVSALLSGTARVARVQAPSSNDHARGLQVVACSVAAPVLTAFAGWVLQEAARRGIRRLYFVSRDGYVIKDFAQRLAATMESAPEIRYLYGSRQAWRSVSMTHAGQEDFSSAFEATASVSVNAVFERLGTTPSIAEDLLGLWNYAPSEWARTLSPAELEKLKAYFDANVEIRNRIATAVSSRRDAALAYLKQEGLFDDDSWALVDLGWHGSLQTSLSALLREQGSSCPLGLYFGLRSRGSKGPADAECAAFAFDIDREGGEVPVPDLLYVMESFCTAPHGTCTRYQFLEGHYHPEFRAGHEAELAEWGLKTVHEAYERYRELLSVELLSKINWKHFKIPAIELLRKFSVNPGLNEARAWGRFPYENDQNAAPTSPLALPKSADPRSLLHCMKIGATPHSFIEWEGGSWSQTGPLAQWLLRATCMVGQAKSKLGRFIKGQS